MKPGPAERSNCRVDRPVFRYAMIGAGSALTYNLILITVNAAGVHYLVASLTAFAIVVIGAYCAHAAFTFHVAFCLPGLLRFAGTQALGFPISAVMLAGFIDGAGLPVWLATLITTLLLFAYNFFSAQWAVLRENGRSRSE